MSSDTTLSVLKICYSCEVQYVEHQYSHMTLLTVVLENTTYLTITSNLYSEYKEQEGK